ncbi:frequency clock protein [Xylariaceae sp. FL0804]|nr:frequency clock protein [Xylariaceae sp. FL0804]
MSDPKNTPAGSEPPPTTTYKNPRRTSPENSITLKHHRLAREAARRHSPPNISHHYTSVIKSPRRNSSGESNDTGISDPKKWFDRSNKNVNPDVSTMDTDDPPFYQKATDSSNGEMQYGVPTQSPAYNLLQSRGPSLRPGLTHSSSADDYRSVIDDLTVENKRLKEELKKYKQIGPDSLRRDKLFEVKVHGLPSRRKRELEAALRDFTTSIEGSSTGESPIRKKSGKSKNLHSAASKHASSSSGSNSRPVDSAYASMSGPSTSALSLHGQGKAARQQTNQNIEDYLRDIPEGLWPRPTVLTEKEKKKLVVKRLETLFTGREGVVTQQPFPGPPYPITEDVEMEDAEEIAQPSKEATREARIRRSRDLKRRESHSRGTTSGSNTQSQSQTQSNGDGDQTEYRDNANGSGSGSGHGGSGGSGAQPSPQNNRSPPEQRPTRPHDLDPDRKQVPAENMDYIRHLGQCAPSSHSRFSAKDVSPDADGWVYLNLLSNLAQLHIFNVTPDFIRNAVAEKSEKFQLSPDGRKIRWRGGAEGTRFGSDQSSGSTSQRQASSDETDGSNDLDQRKKRRTTQGPVNDIIATKPTKSGLGLQDSNSSESFHYKPLFVHHQTASSDEQPSMLDESGSSFGPVEESNLGVNSGWGQSGVSLGVPQRKRRRDGAIIYYSGAPFCTDLSGDYADGEVSPDTYGVTSSGDQGPVSLDIHNRPRLSRTSSGSSIPFHPLSGRESQRAALHLDDPEPPELTAGETDDDIDADFPWSDGVQQAPLVNLEASGIGGTYPDDHFVVVVSTKRPKDVEVTCDRDSDSSDEDVSQRSPPSWQDRLSQDTNESRSITETIVGQLADMSTGSPVPIYVSNGRGGTVELEYVSGKIRRLPPVPLPPPAFYFPECDSDYDSDSDDAPDNASVSSERSVLSKRAMMEEELSDNAELSGNDEEDEDSDPHMYDLSSSVSPDHMRRMSGVDSGRPRGMPGMIKKLSGSSVATRGAASGYNSSMEDA